MTEQTPTPSTRATGLTIERHEAEPCHRCPLPAWWWQRRRLGLRWGAVVRCDECGQRWRLAYYDGGDKEWERITATEETSRG